MANIYLLKIHPDGYPSEVDPTTSDTVRLPGTSINGNLDLSHNEILNVANPTLGDSAATKSYVDAVASGLDPHEAVIAKTDHELGTNAAKAGSGGTWSSALTTGDKFTVAIDGETPVTITLASAPADKAAAISAINTLYSSGGGTGGTIAYSGTGDNIDIRSNTYGTDSEVAITLADAVWGTEVGITNGTVNGTSFTPAGSGVGHTLTAPTNSASFNTIDGVLLAVNDRVLVSRQAGDDATVHKDNGVYYVSALGNGTSTSFTLTRATDADQGVAGELVQGLYVFVTDGTAAQNTGWTMVTPGSISVDTTPIKFSQFSGAPGITYDQGLKRTLNSVVVELDGSADAQGAGAPTADRKSGLEFDADTSSGKLRVAVQADGGLQRYQTTPYGLGILVDNTDSDSTLGLSADGVKVLGLPASFTIDGDAVDPLVTADNLTTLVDGSETTLHSHPGAGEAERLEYTFTTDGAVALGDPVYITSAGKVQKADASLDAKAFACGIAREAKADGELCNVSLDGIAKSVFSSDKTIGIRWFVASGGGLTSTPPGSSNHVMQMGFTSALRDLLIQKQYVGRKI